MKLSVIVSTLNRENAIIPCLDSIVRAFNNAAPIEAEIVVVDNGSEDDTFAVVRNWVSSHSYHVQLLSEPRKGLAIARNRGMKAAQGELLAFTDDDCRLSEDYVKDLLRHDAADAGEVLRGGRVELGDTNDLPLTILKGGTRERWTKASQSAKFKNLGDCILGANMVMRRETAIRLGNFDERLGAGARIPAGEDTDYTFRAYLAGLAIEFVSDMTIFHFHGRKFAVRWEETV